MKLSTTYSVKAGDTFETIARIQYGTEAEAGRIARANPGVSEPLAPGTQLTLPTAPGAPQDAQSQIPASGDNEVAVLINGQRFRFWSNIRITRSLDAMDIADFGAPFEHDAPGFRDFFRPFAYAPMAITVGGAPLFTGIMVDVTPAVDNNRRTVAVGGYSLPGVLNDCTPPASAFPLEFNDQTLPDIASAIAAPFGVSAEFRGAAGAAFERVACEPGRRALEFLVDLAQQRGLIVSSTERGALLFWRSADTGAPVARLQQGEAPVLSVTPFFTPQQYYSHVTGLEPVIVGLEGAQYTAQNPRLRGVTRPMTYTASDTEGGDIKPAVEAKIGRMFGNAIAYSITLATWRDPSGALWAPNTTVRVTAPDAMIYEEYEFVIRSVEFVRHAAEETATLSLMLPGSFNGEIPEVLPWDA